VEKLRLEREDLKRGGEEIIVERCIEGQNALDKRQVAGGAEGEEWTKGARISQEGKVQRVKGAVRQRARKPAVDRVERYTNEVGETARVTRHTWPPGVMGGRRAGRSGELNRWEKVRRGMSGRRKQGNGFLVFPLAWRGEGGS